MTFISVIALLLVFSVIRTLNGNAKVRVDQNSCVAHLQAEFDVKIGHVVLTHQGSPERVAASDDLKSTTEKLANIDALCFPDGT